MDSLDIIDPAQPIDWTWSPNQGLVARYLCLPYGIGSKGNVWRNLHRKIGADGTLTGVTPSVTSGFIGPTGRPGGWGAFAADGTDDYFLAAISASGYTAFSLSFWMYFISGTGAGVFQWATTLGDGSPLALLQRQTTDANWRWLADNAVFSADITISSLAWHCVGITVDGTTWRTYLDGVAGVTVTTGFTQQARGTGLYLGNGFDGYTAAYFDDLCVWKNRVLSANDMWQVYNDSKTGYQRSLRRIAPWSFGVTTSVTTNPPTILILNQARNRASSF